MILRPESPVTKSITCVGCGDGIVTALLPERNDRFRDVVYGIGLRWDGSRWARQIGILAGDPMHRAAELAQALVAAGFIVEAADEICGLAVSGEYKPECRKWILAARDGYAGWFRIWWKRPVDDWNRATKLTASQYDRATKSIVVPPEHYAEVVDYAEMHGYQWSDKARALLEQAKHRRADMMLVSLNAPERGQSTTGPATLLLSDPSEFIDFPQHDFKMKTELMPHQEPAVEKLAPLRIGALFMDMGLGKTRCAIELVHRRRHRISRALWYCPVSLKATIAHEIEKHADGASIYQFDDATTTESLPDGAFWYIIGIESMSASDRMVLAADALTDENTFVVVDESSYIKGHDSKRTKRITAMAERARYRLILTGTPLSQGVVDLYAQMRFLSPRILGYQSFYSFAANHLEYHPDYPEMVVRAHRTDFLAEKIAPFAYQITKDEAGIDLPAKIYDERHFCLTSEQAEAYEQAKWEFLMGDSERLLDSYVIFQLFTALQQIVSGYRKLDGQVIEFPHKRLECLSSVLNSIPESEPVIVWCKYVHSLRAIATMLADSSPALYYGALDERERAAELARFRAGDTRYLIATLATGGHGLTLNEAAYAVFYENGFKYSERIQAEDRNHRIGQTRRPTYIDIIASCGIEKRIMDALKRKEDVVSAFRRQVRRVKDKNRVQERL